jgi:hypothetical protein
MIASNAAAIAVAHIRDPRLRRLTLAVVPEKLRII